ncbi:MAG: hypothetical protein H6733_16600 [Alphaproteobacteria bacterium]|nr:hypothetical protein [Alphaproteobacteria bacterium]
MEDITLALPMEPQRVRTWCWAACALAIDRFYGGRSWTQCAIVRAVFPDCTLCCERFEAEDAGHLLRAVPEACDRPWSLEIVLRDVVGRRAEQVRADAVTFDLVRREVSHGRVVALRWGSADEDGHYAIVHGIDARDGGQGVRLWDSLWLGSQQTPWEAVARGPGGLPLSHVVWTGPERVP